MMINDNSLPPVPQYVESERLLIRPSTRADAPYLKRWWNDPQVTGPSGDQSGMQYSKGCSLIVVGENRIGHGQAAVQAKGCAQRDGGGGGEQPIYG